MAIPIMTHRAVWWQRQTSRSDLSMDFAIEIATDGTAAGQMTYDKAENSNLMNNVWLSLMIPRGGFFQNPDFGLRPRNRQKNTARNANLVVEDYKEALQWLLDTGKAKEINVYTERDRSPNGGTTQSLNRLKMLVEVTPAAGDKVTFERFVEVV